MRLAYPNDEYSSVLEQLVVNQFILGLENFEMEKQVQFAHPQMLQAAIATAVEYDAFTSAQSNPRQPRDIDNSSDLHVRVVSKDKTDSSKSKIDKISKEENPNKEIQNLAQTLNSCIEKLTEKLEALCNQNEK